MLNSGDDSIYNEFRYLCGISLSDTTTYPVAALARGSNLALDRVVTLIVKNDKKWQWDDTNQTDLPVATTDLVASQQDYSLAVTHLKISEVKVEDTTGNLRALEKLQTEEIEDAINRFTSTGQPLYYGLRGNSIFLVPSPSFASTAGLKIYFQRGASYFVSGDTTKVPGFATPFHRLIALYQARDYCSTKGMKSREMSIKEEIFRLEQELQDFYLRRAGDENTRLSFVKDNFGEDESIANDYPKGFY